MGGLWTFPLRVSRKGAPRRLGAIGEPLQFPLPIGRASFSINSKLTNSSVDFGGFGVN